MLNLTGVEHKMTQAILGIMYETGGLNAYLSLQAMRAVNERGGGGGAIGGERAYQHSQPQSEHPQQHTQSLLLASDYAGPQADWH